MQITNEKQTEFSKFFVKKYSRGDGISEYVMKKAINNYF